MRFQHQDDDLAAARGILNGLLISLGLWLMIAAVWGRCECGGRLSIRGLTYNGATAECYQHPAATSQSSL